MSREVLRELASAVARLRRVRIDVEQVERWAERLEENLAELELLLGLALPDALTPAFEPMPLPPAAPPDRPNLAATSRPAGVAEVTGAHLAQPPGPATSPPPAPPATPPAGEPLPPTLVETARRLRRGELDPEALVEQLLTRASRLQHLRAYIALFADEARRQAARSARALREGRAGLLEGIPLAIKDLMRIQGYAMTGGSRALCESPAESDAEVVARLRRCGAVILGAANLHELAYGITSENPHFGAVRNPRDPDRIAGGSSGGSAAALAAGLALGAVGTDTGGSIRIPAAACGVAGLKPTLRRVSREGVLPLSWSLDHVGPMGVRVADVAVLWAAMADDPTPQEVALARRLVGEAAAGPEEPFPALQACLALAEGHRTPDVLRAAVAGLRAARPDPSWLGAMEPAVAQAWEKTLQRLQELGVSVVAVEFPSMAYIRAAQFVILQTEAAAVHRTRLYSRAEDLGPDVRLRLQIGEFLMAVDYVQAQRLRRRVAESFLGLFERHGVDLLLVPTLPCVAPPLGTRVLRLGDAAEPIHRAMTRFTAPFNQSGLPALSVPAGADDRGLPVGLQVVGRPGAELAVLRMGMVVEALAGQP